VCVEAGDEMGRGNGIFAENGDKGFDDGPNEHGWSPDKILSSLVIIVWRIYIN
jgi:hypothetical protein